MNYNETELLACKAARVLEDNSTVMVGTGLPLLACMLAQRTHAPDLTTVFEAGGIGASPPYLPISVGESATFYQGCVAGSMHQVMSHGQAGLIEYGFLGGAQIDKYGNLNSTVIGGWDQPKVRFPGSGGANDIGSWAWRSIYIIRQDARKFVPDLDFMTTPGYLDGPGAREEAGLPSDTGPYRVVTQLGIYGFDEDSKGMKLLALHPNVTKNEVQDNSSFEIIIPKQVRTTDEPTEEQLNILREIDDEGIII